MANDAGTTTSIWMRTPLPTYPPLQDDARCDVCIVGAGIAGLSTAYLLCKAGLSVLVLDDGDIASGETARTTAHLTHALDDRYCRIERLHGVDGARLAAESHSAGIDLIESIVNEELIACDFLRLDGYLFVSPGESPDLLDEELAAAHRAGLIEVQKMAHMPLRCFDTGPCLRFPRQAQFHPLKYVSGLAHAITVRGGRICCGTHADAIEGGRTAEVATSAGRRVSAQAVVVATNTPVNDRLVIHTKQAAYRTYVIGVPVPHGSVPLGLYWDTGDPYHYVRLARSEQPDEEILVVGGEDHKTAQADDAELRFARLEAWTRERFPMAADLAYRWSGQVLEPVDALAFIGRNPGDKENVYVATGDSGNGMTHGTIAALLLTDLITGRTNPWATLYDPARKPGIALRQFAQENANFLAQYASWMTGGQVEDAAQIAPGHGAVLRNGFTKVAVYRDDEGVVHACNARCPHLGCVVDWNATERTWDCPCHGSRFDALGAVINGPANVGLDAVDDDELRGLERGRTGGAHTRSGNWRSE